MSQTPAASISLVVSADGSADSLSRCLSAAMQLLDAGDLCEIIVVDTGTACDATTTRPRHPQVAFYSGTLDESESVRNRGWRHATGALAWFLTSDCVPDKTALTRLRAQFDDPTVQGAGGECLTSPAYDPRRSGTLDATVVDRTDAVRDVASLSPCNVLYRCSALKLTGGFNGALGISQDSELASRLRAAGGRLRYDRAACVERIATSDLHRELRVEFLQSYHHVRNRLPPPLRSAEHTCDRRLERIQSAAAATAFTAIPLTFTAIGGYPLIALLVFSTLLQILANIRSRRVRGRSLEGRVRYFGLLGPYARGLGLLAGLADRLLPSSQSRPRSVGKAAIVIVTCVIALLAFVVAVHRIEPPPDLTAVQWATLKLRWTRLWLLTSFVSLAAIVALFRHRVASTVVRYFSTAGSAFDLAVFRIVLFAVLFRVSANTDFGWFVSLPDSMIIPPTGMSWLADSIFFNAAFVRIAEKMCCAAAALSVVGLGTRYATATAALTYGFLAALPHFDGKVDHGHHLAWFAALLATSPCGDRLSIDAFFRKTGDRTDSIRYSLPLRFCWILFGMIYFFPGFWKLWSCGLDWCMSSNLQMHLYAKWAEIGNWTPRFRIDLYPSLCQAAAAATILFEISFVFCLFWSRARAVAVTAALAFHNATFCFMAISFWTLQICYVAFVPWSRLLRLRSSVASPPAETSWLSSPATVVIGLLLVFGNIDAGLRRDLNGYPLTCYPTFDYLIRSPRIARMELCVRTKGGDEKPIDFQALGPMGSAGAIRVQSRILREPDRDRRDLLVRDLKRILQVDDGDELTVYRVVESVHPDFRRVLTREPLHLSVP